MERGVGGLERVETRKPGEHGERRDEPHHGVGTPGGGGRPDRRGAEERLAAAHRAATACQVSSEWTKFASTGGLPSVPRSARRGSSPAPLAK
jgi:hypothetical protein